MKKAALAYVNGLRAGAGLPPLTELPKGVRSIEGRACPLNRAAPAEFYISTLYLVNKRRDTKTNLPKKVTEFIQKFDRGEYPELVA